MKHISIIVPTYNEEKNISLLIQRIDQACYLHQLDYEIIVVDDNSKDKTREVIHSLQDVYPVKLYKKIGEKGKSQSLLEGFQYASAEYIAFIDADLQYPPEVIPFMLQECIEKADIIVANREYASPSLMRKMMSKTFRIVFGKVLHGINADVQSGMKVFRKEIIERLELNPSEWSFDLEFLVKAREAGYKIAEYDITFKKRKHGKSQIHPLTSSIELSKAALSLKLRKKDVIRFSKKQKSEQGSGFTYKGETFIHHSPLPMHQTAFWQLTRQQQLFLSTIAVILIAGFVTNWQLTAISLLAVITLFYFIDLTFHLILILKTLYKEAHLRIKPETLSLLSDSDLPLYTILCPLYKEVSVIPQFIKAIEKIDYPKDKLQVLLLLEEDDKETISYLSQGDVPRWIEPVIVPDSKPKTKPKACNYGLLHAKGEFIVIYDAEDMPDPRQLKKSVAAFRFSPSSLGCVQAKLNFYNDSQNLLTRFFTAEYAVWFDLILPGLQMIKAPIPLGGTSNHFRTEVLKKLGGWDSFNVTEDADLGVRLAKRGYHTQIIDSTTLEEANSHFLNWMNQRTRWLKGYMQTYFVHMRKDPNTTLRQVLFINLIMGGKIFSLIVNPFMWLMTISYFVFKPITGELIESLFPPYILYLGVFCLVVGNFLYLYYAMLGLMHRKKYGLVKYMALMPFYWLFMSIAAVRAGFQLITNPHYWAKTKHGLHLSEEQQKSVTNSWSPTVNIDIPYMSLHP